MGRLWRRRFSRSMNQAGPKYEPSGLGRVRANEYHGVSAPAPPERATCQGNRVRLLYAVRANPRANASVARRSIAKTNTATAPSTPRARDADTSAERTPIVPIAASASERSKTSITIPYDQREWHEKTYLGRVQAKTRRLFGELDPEACELHSCEDQKGIAACELCASEFRVSRVELS